MQEEIWGRSELGARGHSGLARLSFRLHDRCCCCWPEQRLLDLLISLLDTAMGNSSSKDPPLALFSVNEEHGRKLVVRLPTTATLKHLRTELEKEEGRGRCGSHRSGAATDAPQPAGHEEFEFAIQQRSAAAATASSDDRMHVLRHQEADLRLDYLQNIGYHVSISYPHHHAVDRPGKRPRQEQEERQQQQHLERHEDSSSSERPEKKLCRSNDGTASTGQQETVADHPVLVPADEPQSSLPPAATESTASQRPPSASPPEQKVDDQKPTAAADSGVEQTRTDGPQGAANIISPTDTTNISDGVDDNAYEETPEKRSNETNETSNYPDNLAIDNGEAKDGDHNMGQGGTDDHSKEQSGGRACRALRDVAPLPRPPSTVYTDIYDSPLCSQTATTNLNHRGLKANEDHDEGKNDVHEDETTLTYRSHRELDVFATQESHQASRKNDVDQVYKTPRSVINTVTAAPESRPEERRRLLLEHAANDDAFEDDVAIDRQEEDLQESHQSEHYKYEGESTRMDEEEVYQADHDNFCNTATTTTGWTSKEQFSRAKTMMNPTLFHRRTNI